MFGILLFYKHYFSEWIKIPWFNFDKYFVMDIVQIVERDYYTAM